MFYNIKITYLCTVFFMVLDLRLTMKIGCRDDNLFLFYRVAFLKMLKFTLPYTLLSSNRGKSENS